MLKQISNLDQVAYIREYTITSGREAGVEVIELYNGVLRVLLNKTKALDIMQVFHKGMNVSFVSKNGFSTRSDDFAKRFEGGMMYTVGLDSAGARDGFVMHGSFHNLKPIITRCEIVNHEIIVEAHIDDSELFGKHLSMYRKYCLAFDSNEFILKDTLINKGQRDEEYCILYHNNIGYPMLDDGGEISINAESVLPRTNIAKERLGVWNRITEPVDLDEEACYFIKIKDGIVSYANKSINRKITIEYSKNSLPEFVLWRSLRSKDYALGLEPSTTKLDDSFKYKTIKKDESIDFELKYTIIDLL